MNPCRLVLVTSGIERRRMRPIPFPSSWAATIIRALSSETDAAEDAQYGKGKRGDELPAELARRESRIKKRECAKLWGGLISEDEMDNQAGS